MMVMPLAIVQGTHETRHAAFKVMSLEAKANLPREVRMLHEDIAPLTPAQRRDEIIQRCRDIKVADPKLSGWADANAYHGELIDQIWLTLKSGGALISDVPEASLEDVQLTEKDFLGLIS